MVRDQEANPLVDMLPAVLHFRGTTDGRPAGWLEPVLRIVALETDERALGADAVLARLSDVIVIQAIRAHLANLPLGGHGWLHALADAQLGAALALIHEHPEAPWTVEKLASEVGMSRSSFAVRFTAMVGEAPLRYVTRWRIHCAQRLLRANGAKVAEVAARVGYTTEPAFSCAFKRWAGQAPGEFRREALSAIENTANKNGKRAK
jgi:AraC-like DNA-binding protein